MDNLHIRLTKAQVESVFQLLDQDNDNFLSFREFSLLAKGGLKDIEDSNVSKLSPSKSMVRIRITDRCLEHASLDAARHESHGPSQRHP
jgi:hypothetical protein